MQNYLKNFRISLWGKWSNKEALQILPIEKWEMRKDLSGVYFRTSTAHDPPYVFVVDVDNKTNILPQGYKVKQGEKYIIYSKSA